MVAYLEKSEGSEGFHQIIDFISTSHIQYALTEIPTLYASPIEQFWQTAALSTLEDGVIGITATIDRKVKVLVTEASIRIHLKLEDSEGLSTLLTEEIFKQLPLVSNMKMASKGYSGVITPLFDTMLVQHQDEEPSIHSTPETSPSRITSSPSLSPQHTPISAPSTSQPPNIQSKPVAEESTLMPNESPLQSVHSLRHDKGSLSLHELTVLCTSLSKKVKSLEYALKKESRHIEKNSADTEILLEEEEPTELVEDFGSGEKGEKEISTANVPVNTASAVPADISTAIPERQVYIRRSAEKRKDKGKAIMQDDESVQKKTKKQLEQERLGHEVSIRLQEQLTEEERQQIARDAEIAK
ncbi:hypothetical protein Tco_0542360, partial [Tanacetum coccineum]